MKPKGTQFIQLPMFAPAGELADPEKFGHRDSEGFGSDSGRVGRPRPAATSHEVMARVKIGESLKPGSADDAWRPHGSGQSLHDSIKESGVKEPVMLDQENGLHVADGHHRVFAAADIDPKMEVPLTYNFPDIDYTWKGPLGDTPNWTDRTRNPDQPDPWPAREPRKED